jgi:hypothetical protein
MEQQQLNIPKEYSSHPKPNNVGPAFNRCDAVCAVQDAEIHVCILPSKLFFFAWPANVTLLYSCISAATALAPVVQAARAWGVLLQLPVVSLVLP